MTLCLTVQSTGKQVFEQTAIYFNKALLLTKSLFAVRNQSVLCHIKRPPINHPVGPDQVERCHTAGWHCQ